MKGPGGQITDPQDAVTACTGVKTVGYEGLWEPKRPFRDSQRWREERLAIHDCMSQFLIINLSLLLPLSPSYRFCFTREPQLIQIVTAVVSFQGAQNFVTQWGKLA